MNETADTETTAHDQSTLNRRRVLKAAGATALASALVPGAASAHETEPEPEVVFCGCSQVCVCSDATAWIVLATETDDGFEKEHVKRTGNFCYEVSGNVKIIAVQLDGEYWCNPGNCAEKAIEQTGYECDNRDAETGQCGHPPCEHPGRDGGPGDERGDGNQKGDDKGNGRGKGRGNGRGKGNGR